MIQLYVLGYKGYIIIKNISEDVIPGISLVVIGSDSNVINDYSHLIQSECIAKGIPFCLRKDEFTTKEVKYKITKRRHIIDGKSITQAIYVEVTEICHHLSYLN